jgi:hypothetical protein
MGLATSRLQILPRVDTSRMQIFVDFIHVVCDWRSRGYNLQGTGGHSGTNYMQLATSCMQILDALADSCVQNRQFITSTLQEQFFELKNEGDIKKSENLRSTCAC